MNNVKYLGLECASLQNERITLLVPREVGPRIVALFIEDENIFAELPDLKIDNPDGDPFRFWGGHRLWYGPEIPERTYLPDSIPPEIEISVGRIVSTQLPESETGIQKSISAWLPNDWPRVIVDHFLTNKGKESILCAPWAITQLKPGGTAILPLYSGNTDPHGLQPNRSIALWPYTDINSGHIIWGNRYTFVEADMNEGALKVGLPNPVGWIAYCRNNKLFVKHASFEAEASYLYFSSSSQCYFNEHFLELETLGPRIALEPGKSVSHREVWEIFTDFEHSRDELELGEKLKVIDVQRSRAFLTDEG